MSPAGVYDVLMHTAVSLLLSQHLEPPLLWNVPIWWSQVVISSLEWLPNIKKAEWHATDSESLVDMNDNHHP